MEHCFYDFSKGVDVYDLLNEQNKPYDCASFLRNAVGDISRVSFNSPLNNKLVSLKEIRFNNFKCLYKKNLETHLFKCI